MINEENDAFFKGTKYIKFYVIIKILYENNKQTEIDIVISKCYNIK